MEENIIVLLKYLLLGLLQGVTEPIPVSSSGHLVVLQALIGVEIEGLSFEVFVHFASLLAILYVYREDLRRIVTNCATYVAKREPRAKTEYLFTLYILIGTIPAALLGFLFDDVISETLTGVSIVGVTLLLTGVALWLIRKLRGHKGEKNMSVKDALLVGGAQAVALIPGISRSGATLVSAMALGIDRPTALRYSFMLYIPISLGGTILKVPDMWRDPLIQQLTIPYIVAFLAAFLATYVSLKIFIDVMRRGKLVYFAFYCWIAGTLILTFL
ncbi:undecaprenyl-diphosphate phosphatase [Numidum massiliense]|uniref:undecaprenyl-diphosphate phosphatase n=1 Tax=Numidum massiliense TaxID=1522315 RepID=UPI0006D5A0A5|nr:undecaprenyl-diphosphate phosphatase [Numidum massiliense]